MTVTLSPELEHRLQQFADEAGRTPSDVAQQAVDEYLHDLRTLTDEVREGEESAEREGWLTQDEVFARLHARLPKTA